jgi:Holliday junction resolvase RusA-like endonuclease
VSVPDVRITVPGVPKALQRNRHRIVKTKSGNQFIANYLPAESRAEQGTVRLFASLAMKGGPPLEGPLELRMTAFMPIPASWSKRKQHEAMTGGVRPTGKPDLSNLLKQVEDGIKAVCYRDDSQIVALHVWKAFSDTPRVVVEIRCLTFDPIQPRAERDTTAVTLFTPNISVA